MNNFYFSDYLPLQDDQLEIYLENIRPCIKWNRNKSFQRIIKQRKIADMNISPIQKESLLLFMLVSCVAMRFSAPQNETGCSWFILNGLVLLFYFILYFVRLFYLKECCRLKTIFLYITWVLVDVCNLLLTRLLLSYVYVSVCLQFFFLFY